MKTFLKNFSTALKETGYFLVINALGMGIYFRIRAWLLASYEYDHMIDPVRGWLGSSLPLFALCFGINVTYLLMSRKNGLLSSARLSIWLVVCLVWGIVVACDPINLRAFIEILEDRAWP